MNPEFRSAESAQGETRLVWLMSYVRWYKVQSLYPKQRFATGVQKNLTDFLKASNNYTDRIKIFPITFCTPECIHNSAVHDKAFTMCFIRKFERKRLNLLTDSNEKRWVLLLLLLLLLSSPRTVRAMVWDHSLQSCFLSITIFRWINIFPAPKYGFYNHFRVHFLSVSG